MPVVERKSGQVITITGNHIQMMDMKDFQTIEITAPEDKISQIEVGKEIMYLESLGKRKLDIE